MLHNWAPCGLVMQCITASGTSFFRIELVVVLYVVFCIFYGMDFASLKCRSFSVFHAHSEPSPITSHYVASAAVSSFQLLKQSMVSRKGETSEIRALLWHSAPPCSYSRNLHLHKLHKHAQAPNRRATHELCQGSICHAAWRSIMLASLKWHNMT